MSDLEDNRLVDYLYDEMDPSERRAFQEELQTDQALAQTLEDMESMLGTLRTLEVEEAPSDHLDSLILAQARQSVETQKESWIQKLLHRPRFALAFSGAFALVVAVIVLPSMQTQEAMNDFSGVEVQQAQPKTASKMSSKPSLEIAAEPAEVAAEEESVKPLEKFAENHQLERKPSKAPAFQAENLNALKGKKRKLKVVKRGKKSNSGRSGMMGGATDSIRRPQIAERSLKAVAQVSGNVASRSGLKKGTVDPSFGPLGSDESAAALGSKGSGAATPPAAPSARPAPPAPARARRATKESATARAPAASKAEFESLDDESARSVQASASPAKRTRSAAPTDAAGSIPQDPSQREAWAREQARNAQKIARNFLKNGDIRSARRTYLKTRTWVRGTLAFFEVSLWLAQLEYSQGRFAEARRFASEAGRSRDESVQQKAREVVARVREDQGQSDSVPASTE